MQNSIYWPTPLEIAKPPLDVDQLPAEVEHDRLDLVVLLGLGGVAGLDVLLAVVLVLPVVGVLAVVGLLAVVGVLAVGLLLLRACSNVN